MTTATRQTWRQSLLGTVNAITARRKAAGIDQEHAAARIGVSLRTYQRIESGERDLSAPELFSLAALVGMDITATERASA